MVPPRGIVSMSMKPTSKPRLSLAVNLATAAFLASSSGCVDEGVYVVPESQAGELIREVLEERGVDAVSTTEVVAGLSVCVEGSPCRTITLTLDGWDEATRVGFAYLSDADRDLPSSTRIEMAEAEAIQAQLDERREELGLIVVFREWAHETESLAVDQLRRAAETAFDTRGLIPPM